MSNFYDKLPFEAAAEMERLSRLMYELRENRKALLTPYDASDEAVLLTEIAAGRIEEHPAYEHYLGGRILNATHEAIRSQLRAFAGGLKEPSPPPLHLELQPLITSRFADRLDGQLQVAQDALLLRLMNGVAMEMRFAAAGAYAISWQWGEAIQRIDTAPLHRELGTFPHHWHDATGEVRADPLTDPARSPWDNIHAVIQAVLADPLLGS